MAETIRGPAAVGDHVHPDHRAGGTATGIGNDHPVTPGMIRQRLRNRVSRVDRAGHIHKGARPIVLLPLVVQRIFASRPNAQGKGISCSISTLTGCVVIVGGVTIR